VPAEPTDSTPSIVAEEIPAVPEKPTPTIGEYGSFQRAFDHLNFHLFGGQLDQVLFTLERQGGCVAYFAADVYTERHNPDHHVHQINITPDYLAGDRPKMDILGVIGHQMCREREHMVHGPLSGNYTRKTGAEIMKAVGLYPSKTGMPGGDETGKGIQFYIIKGSDFERVAKNLIASDWEVDLGSTFREGRQAKERKPAPMLVCELCGQDVKAKHGLQISCTDCLTRRLTETTESWPLDREQRQALIEVLAQCRMKVAEPQVLGIGPVAATSTSEPELPFDLPSAA
jgi:hypothetical protein